MHTRALLPTLTLVALAFLAISSGCTADPTADAAGDADRPDAALMAPEALASFLPPAPPGWRLLGSPSPVTLEEDGIPFTSATASYLPDSDPDGTGNRSADLVIQDTGGRPVGLRKLADLRSTAPGGAAPSTLGGRPAFVIDEGTLTGAYLVVADRFIVWLAVTGGTRADLEAFVNAMDLEALSGQR